MMMFLGGLGVACGVVSMIAAFGLGLAGERERGTRQEFCAIGWFILAAICFH